MQQNRSTGISFSLQFEGGFCNDPRDPGGATNKGITFATFKADVDPHGTLQDLRNMSTACAVGVYLKHYWTQINADALPGGVDVLANDIAINMGVGRARQFLAQTANLSAAARVQRLHNLRLGFWKRLATWAHFGKGWTARETACLKLARSLV